MSFDWKYQFSLSKTKIFPPRSLFSASGWVAGARLSFSRDGGFIDFPGEEQRAVACAECNASMPPPPDKTGCGVAPDAHNPPYHPYPHPHSPCAHTHATHAGNRAAGTTSA